MPTLVTKDLPKSMKKDFLLISLQGTACYFEIPSTPSHLFKCKTVFREMRRGAFLVECSFRDYRISRNFYIFICAKVTALLFFIVLFIVECDVNESFAIKVRFAHI